MSETLTISLGAPLALKLTLTECATEMQRLPLVHGDILNADPAMLAIGLEFEVPSAEEAPNLSFPLQFWGCRPDGAPETWKLSHMPAPLLDAIDTGITGGEYAPLSGIGGHLAEALVQAAKLCDTRHVFVLFMQDVTIFMPSHLGDTLNDIDDTDCATAAEYQSHLAKLVPFALISSEGSAHERLQRAERIGAQISRFDQIFHRLTDVRLTTTPVFNSKTDEGARA